MTTAIQNLIRLSEALAQHDDVTHWTISSRLFRKGDFFHRLRNSRDILTGTYEMALGRLSEAWPADLEWPADIPRPTCAAEQDGDAA